MQEALLKSNYFSRGENGGEKEYLYPLILPRSKREAKEYLASVPFSTRMRHLSKIGTDGLEAIIQHYDLVSSPEYVRGKRQENGTVIIYSGGFLTSEEISRPSMTYLEKQGFTVVYDRYRAEKYPNRRQAPSYLPRGSNVEPLEWQVEDFIDFAIEVSDKYKSEITILGESKGGLKTKLALMMSSELRDRTRIAITAGSPGPVIENVNVSILSSYIDWQDYFGGDDFKYTPLLTPFNVERLRQFGLVSIENFDDRIIGPGIEVGNVYSTDVGHSAMLRNRGILNFISDQINMASGRENKITENTNGKILQFRPPHNHLQT